MFVCFSHCHPYFIIYFYLIACMHIMCNVYYNCLFQIMLCTRHFGSMGLVHSFNTTRRCLLGSTQYYLPRSTHLFRLSHLPRFIQYRSQYLPNSSVRKAITPVSASLIIIICFRKQCSHISKLLVLSQWVRYSVHLYPVQCHVYQQQRLRWKQNKSKYQMDPQNS